MPGVISLELNELNFDLLEHYVTQGKLLHFQRLLSDYKRYDTVAESEFSHVEPWIQWVTVHTGLDFAEHGVFRLGDITDAPYEQIWERLERELGVTVAALSPMNASLAAKQPAFFVPDPWTTTEVHGSLDLRLLYKAIRASVNNNAEGSFSVGSLIRLAVGAAFNIQWKNLLRYATLARRSLSRKWLRAAFLDFLLTDTFITQWNRHRPTYATLMLNAAAHVQHHYMFSSPHYDGVHRNPGWYVAEGEDPVGDIYRVYDAALGELFKLVDAHQVRLLVMTGLSQVANPEIIYYYRPLDHSRLMELLNVQGVTKVEPRMSRDFLVEFDTEEATRRGGALLSSVTMEDGSPLFSVDNRGRTLFVKVAYIKEMQPGLTASVNGTKIADVDSLFVHVSIENAIHSTVGTFIDCGEPAGVVEKIPLPSLFDYAYSTVKRQLP
ncbi:alkaline phosphatase family protein [Blastococcus brunescens]|uniref:Alkaline phosphatase family protein n=1 Tax=Blastococcus brunescens TaxID=1564165 RepID=A0ABZ1B0F8_9ACTN|nr:alkaline phosphatase family protein [Blastococcus sp. BMG 8361]WRL64284.1 alkaline phosphatase family protein [Blastococcus sp. BMG 8361]